jgi:hypothetical protein
VEGQGEDGLEAFQVFSGFEDTPSTSNFVEGKLAEWELQHLIERFEGKSKSTLKYRKYVSLLDQSINGMAAGMVYLSCSTPRVCNPKYYTVNNDDAGKY